MAKPKSAKKRIGRPIKPPKEGERIQLGLRVTPRMKLELEGAAIKNGRSLSQEVELRLEASLQVEQIPVLMFGGRWAPVLFSKDAEEISVLLGSGGDVDDLGGFLIPLKAEKEGDVRLIRTYLSGGPWFQDMKGKK